MKIVIAGPQSSGKTVLADFLVGNRPQLRPGIAALLPGPTAGVRIQECERSLLGLKTAIEVFDCSGDQNYEQCWPAVLLGAHGIILVYNPDKTAHVEEAPLWYEHFVKNTGLDDHQCLLLIHTSKGQAPGRLAAVPPRLSHLSAVNSNWDAGDLVGSKLDSWLMSILNTAPIKGGESQA